MYNTIDICQDIAEKLKNFSSTDPYKQDMGTSWPNFTLTSGTPGIVCFFAAIDYIFPHQGWDDAAHQYLKEAIDSIDVAISEGHSLFGGLTGICFAAYLCSKRGSRYQKLLSKLDSLLIQEVEKDIHFLQKEDIKNQKPIPPYRYNLMFGLTGIIAYLILRKEDLRLLKLAKDCIQTLISILLSQKQIHNKTVPGWYVAPEDIREESEKERNPNGRFILTLPYGVTGCLSVLSLAAWEGIDTPKLFDTIKLLSSWVNQKKVISSSALNWPYALSFESEIGEQQNPDFNLKAWCYGIPAAASSLCLASRVTRDKVIRNSAEEALNKLFSQPMEQDHSSDPSLVYGKAGLLAVTYRMAKLLDSGPLMKTASQLEQEVKSLYSPSHPFGFQYYDSYNQKKWNEPGLLYGASGVGLALLLASGRIDDVLWDRALLIH